MGGKRWTASSLHRMLTNLTYIGKREINKYNRTREQENLKPEERYKIVDAHWPGLVSQKLFSDVQGMLVTNKTESRRYVHHYRLKQLVSCGICGQPLIGTAGTGSHGRYYYYGHKRKMLTQGDRHRERCAVESVSALNLEEAVISRLMELGRNRSLVESLVKASAKDASSVSEQNRALLRSEEEQRKENQRKVDGLMSSLALAPTEQLKRLTYEKIETLTQDIQAADARIAELKSRQKENVIDLEGVFKLLKTFNRAFPSLPAHEQRDFIRDTIKRVVITGPGSATIEYYKSPAEEELFPGLSHAVFPEEFGPFTQQRSVVRTASQMVGPPGLGYYTQSLHAPSLRSLTSVRSSRHPGVPPHVRSSGPSAGTRTPLQVLVGVRTLVSSSLISRACFFDLLQPWRASGSKKTGGLLEKTRARYKRGAEMNWWALSYAGRTICDR